MIRWRMAAFLIVALIARGSSAWGGVVYSVLRDETWRVYYQTDPAAEPRLLSGAIEGDAGAPALSPDRQRVAFEVSGQGIAVCPIDAASACQELRLPRGAAVRPVWHPFTGELLFVRYLADAAGEDSDILTTRDDFSETKPFITQTGIQDYPDVSPDGRLLAYTSSQTVSLARGRVHVIQHLWVMDRTTGVPRQLTTGPVQDIHPDWSPSGAELAFASDRTGQFEIWVVSADGGQSRQLTSGSGAKTWPAWSPDGESIMFTLAHEGRQGLWLIDADGSNLRPFEPFGGTADIELRDADWR